MQKELEIFTAVPSFRANTNNNLMATSNSNNSSYAIHIEQQIICLYIIVYICLQRYWRFSAVNVFIFLYQVIDIVRSNVRAVLQRTWRVSDVDNLRIYRVFSRVFSRLLWSHGQGLWNCFSNSK